MVRTTATLMLAAILVMAAAALGQSGSAADYGAWLPPPRESSELVAQLAYLKASNSQAGDLFGFSVAASGDTVVIGAWGEASNATGVNGDQSDDSAPNAGAVYVFVRIGTDWSQQAYLKASNSQAGDLFGYSVSVSGDTVVVGARGEASKATGVNGDQEDNTAVNAGAAYVFVRSGTNWSQQAYLKASNTDAIDAFGWSVSVSNDTVVVGAGGEDSNATGVDGDQLNNTSAEAGAAYVFVRSGTTWSQQAYLKASNTQSTDHFGDSVAVSGDTVVVGAADEDSNATGINGNQHNNSASGAGAAYVFARSGASWSQQAYLKASNTQAGDLFGGSVAASIDTVVVGASYEDSSATGVNGDQSDNTASTAGCAYIFARTGTSWSQQAYLKASNTGSLDQFGGAVSVASDVVVVGAIGEASDATGVNGDQGDNSAVAAGAAYTFVRSGTDWSQQAYLKASNTEFFDLFGTSVSVSGDTLVVGAYQEDSNATGVNGDESDNSEGSAGAAYVLDLDLDAWADLGSGLVGSSGVPLLVGTGPLSPGSGNQLDLISAKSSSAATLIVGLSQLNAPFKGGTLVPAPLVLVPLATSPSGSVSVPFTWPSNAPPGTALYLQFWISDPGAIAELSASNALEGVSS